MGLLYWLPMLGSLKNQGLLDVQPINHGATVGTNGKLGKCYDFAGTNASYIDSGFKEEFGTGDFSIAVWFKLTDSGSRTYQAIISNKSAGATSVGCAIYYNHSQNKFLWSTADGSAAAEIWSLVDTRQSYSTILNNWHHIVMVRNSSDPKIGYFYLDGERLELTSVPLIRNVTNTSYNMMIGGIITPRQDYAWTGSLCDLRIYDHAISAKEAKLLSQGLTIHYPLALPGNENLIKKLYSGGRTTVDGRTITALLSQNLDTYFSISCSETLVTGEDYTLSLYCSGFPSSDNNLLFGIINQNSGKTITLKNGFCYATFSPDSDIAANTKITLDDQSRTNCGFQDIMITNIKLEKGSIATPWLPNPADTAYSSAGFDDGIEYDVSGFGYNGIKNNITIDSDTPKYNTCYKLNGTNSYIKCDTSDWMVQGAEEMTYSFWAHSINWTAYYNRMISCTESGGFNIEAGESGYVRFPIHCYSNVDHTSGTYYYNNQGLKLSDLTVGWHMITYVYTTTSQKIYIDGELYDTYSATTYGIHFHSGARLFLGCEAAGSAPQSPYFNGKLSDFRLYYTALTADEIADLYHTSSSITSNGTLLTSEVNET